VFDRNLKALAEKVRATSFDTRTVGPARAERIPGGEAEPADVQERHGDSARARRDLRSPQTVGPQNLHPFRFGDARVVLAQNGALHRFDEMRYDLLEFIGPKLASYIQGTTDTEWVYALVLSRLADPFGPATAEDLVRATEASLAILGDLRERHGIGAQSPVNLVLGDGDSLVATRFCFDYGWYPEDGSFFAGEREFDFTTLWYTFGERYAPGEGGWDMRFGARVGAALIASEPLTSDATGWIEAPEYALLVVTRDADQVSVDVQELAV
jgi:glutamine amidotransferase